MTEKYQGWSNYETWNVNLWLNNDEATYREIRALCLDGNDEYAGSQKLQNFVMEEILKVLDRFTETTYSGIVSDVSQANLKLVNWLEIWRGFRE